MVCTSCKTSYNKCQRESLQILDFQRLASLCSIDLWQIIYAFLALTAHTFYSCYYVYYMYHENWPHPCTGDCVSRVHWLLHVLTFCKTKLSYSNLWWDTPFWLSEKAFAFLFFNKKIKIAYLQGMLSHVDAYLSFFFLEAFLVGILLH